MNQSAKDRGIVVSYAGAGGGDQGSHESVTRTEIAKRIAALQGYDFAGEYDPAFRYAGRMYFVPAETLVGIEAARELGIRDEDDLFGGVVPYPFVATKVITHPLVDENAAAPEGWSHGFARRVRDAVPHGYSAFTIADARRAVARILERERARLKLARGIGGAGQIVISGPSDLDAALANMNGEVGTHGVVIEQNLEDVTTYSVGRIRVAGLLATYCGTQRLTTDASGAEVYGGSDLLVARGDFDMLAALDLPPEVRLAVAQAREYDDAATREFSGFFASRRNYDVAQGVDSSGQRRSGVLEQSWRLGGASGAEIAALQVFRADPALRAVRASSVEVYGPAEPPPHATVHYRGVDRQVGPITKYSIVEEADEYPA